MRILNNCHEVSPSLSAASCDAAYPSFVSKQPDCIDLEKFLSKFIVVWAMFSIIAVVAHRELLCENNIMTCKHSCAVGQHRLEPTSENQ